MKFGGPRLSLFGPYHFVDTPVTDSIIYRIKPRQKCIYRSVQWHLFYSLWFVLNTSDKDVQNRSSIVTVTSGEAGLHLLEVLSWHVMFKYTANLFGHPEMFSK